MINSRYDSSAEGKKLKLNNTALLISYWSPQSYLSLHCGFMLSLLHCWTSVNEVNVSDLKAYVEVSKPLRRIANHIPTIRRKKRIAW